jgi:hypothetical protein
MVLGSSFRRAGEREKMASAEKRYKINVPSLSLTDEKGTVMFRIDKDGITWDDMPYAVAVALQEALMKGPIELGKAQAEFLEKGKQ